MKEVENKDVETFLNNDFFDIDIQEQIRKDNLKYIIESNKLKDSKIGLNEIKIEKFEINELRNLLNFS